MTGTTSRTQEEAAAPVELSTLRFLLSVAPERLLKINADTASAKPALDRWSVKEELGHLVDSASNNHERIVRAKLQEQRGWLSYNGERWVRLHAYQQREWAEIVDLWRALNNQLLKAAEALSAADWSIAFPLDGSEPITLSRLFKEYVEHIQHHLRHIGIEIKEP